MITIFNEAYRDLSVYLDCEELRHFSREHCLGGTIYSYTGGKYRFTGRNIFLEFASPVHGKDFYYISRVDDKDYGVLGISENSFQRLISDRYVSGWYDSPKVAKRLGPVKESSLKIIMPQVSIIELGFLEKKNPLLYEKLSGFAVK